MYRTHNLNRQYCRIQFVFKAGADKYSRGEGINSWTHPPPPPLQVKLKAIPRKILYDVNPPIEKLLR